MGFAGAQIVDDIVLSVLNRDNQHAAKEFDIASPGTTRHAKRNLLAFCSVDVVTVEDIAGLTFPEPALVINGETIGALGDNIRLAVGNHFRSHDVFPFWRGESVNVDVRPSVSQVY